MTLAVQPGEVVAIAGPSGCGKSTLLSVLLGLAPIFGGSVRIGEVDLADLDPDAWRAQLAWVPQRPHLFARSIADNVRLGRPDATDDQVRAAMTDAGLDDVVARLPDGIGTTLGHDGAGLSAGERQRVALARAFLRDAPLLLLDEPTANLDGRTEQALLATPSGVQAAALRGVSQLIVSTSSCAACEPTPFDAADRDVVRAVAPRAQVFQRSSRCRCSSP